MHGGLGRVRLPRARLRGSPRIQKADPGSVRLRDRCAEVLRGLESVRRVRGSRAVLGEVGRELNGMPRLLGTVEDQEVDAGRGLGRWGGTRREMWPGRVVAERPGVGWGEGGSALASGSLYCVSDLVMALRRLSAWPSAVGGVTP